jgi:predicted ester cyclase
MSVAFDDLIALWSRPLPEGPGAVAAFARVYADPVVVNGASMPLAALVERARATQRAFADLRAVQLARSDTPTHTTLVFRMSGRHVGPLMTPLGEIPPTGKIVERQIIDLLALEDGLVTEVWMVGDELGALVQMGAITRA